MKSDLQCFYLPADANLALASREGGSLCIDFTVEAVFAVFPGKTAPTKCLLYHICMLQQRMHSNPLLKIKQPHTHTHWALLVLPDKSLSTYRCLCTSEGAEGERSWEE